MEALDAKRALLGYSVSESLSSNCFFVTKLLLGHLTSDFAECIIKLSRIFGKISNYIQAIVFLERDKISKEILKH